MTALWLLGNTGMFQHVTQLSTFRVTFHYLAFQTQVFNALYHVNEKCCTRDI